MEFSYFTKKLFIVWLTSELLVVVAKPLQCDTLLLSLSIDDI